MGQWSPPDPLAAEPAAATPTSRAREATARVDSTAIGLPVASDAHRAGAVSQPRGSAYAGLATRALAFAVDAAIINGVALLVGVVVGLGLSLFDIPSGTRNVFLAVGAALTLVWTMSYFVVFWSAKGQTPGNRLMQIRVQDARTDRPPTHRRALRRVLLLGISALLLFIPTLLVLVDARRRAVHDRLAGTVVVYVPAGPRNRP
jgi:uncharacterized RDD family membrane protein YckC